MQIRVFAQNLWLHFVQKETARHRGLGSQTCLGGDLSARAGTIGKGDLTNLYLSKSNLRFFLYFAIWQKYFSARCPEKLMWWRRSQPWRRWWRRSLQLDLEEKTLTHKFISHFSWEHVELCKWRICQRNPLYTMLGIPHRHSLTVPSGNVFIRRVFLFL